VNNGGLERKGGIFHLPLKYPPQLDAEFDGNVVAAINHSLIP